MVERLDEKAVQKVSGPTWESLREDFFKISRKLLSVCPVTASQLTTIYVKFCTTTAMNEVYAVVWIKTSKQIVVGMSLPDDVEDARLGPAPKGHTYKGLTKFFTVTHDDPIPDGLLRWAKLAYETASGTAGR
jgi:hypothetical protein